MAKRNDSNIIAYLLRDKKGNLFQADLEDITDEGLIFRVARDAVRSGHFADEFIDSRYFENMGLELLCVFEGPTVEQ
jgi:hypothetical protein